MTSARFEPRRIGWKAATLATEPLSPGQFYDKTTQGWHLKVSDFNETLGLESPWLSIKKNAPPIFWALRGQSNFAVFAEFA